MSLDEITWLFLKVRIILFWIFGSVRFFFKDSGSHTGGVFRAVPCTTAFVAQAPCDHKSGGFPTFPPKVYTQTLSLRGNKVEDFASLIFNTDSKSLPHKRLTQWLALTRVQSPPKDKKVVRQYGTRGITLEWFPWRPPTQSFFGFLDFFFEGLGVPPIFIFPGQHSSHFVGSFGSRKLFKKTSKPPQGSPCSVSTPTWFLSIYSLSCFFPLFPPIFTNFNFFKGHFRDINCKITPRGPCRSDQRITPVLRTISCEWYSTDEVGKDLGHM